MYRIVRREAFSDTTFLWEVEAPDVAAAAQPGHFVMVRLHEGSERIPLTVADFDRQRGTITMVVQALGKTSREMMHGYAEGDTFDDFVGPLGLPQHVGKVGHVVLVGGGLGVAPVYPQLRAFKEAGNRVTGVIGFRSKGLVFWEERFRQYCDELVVCTDDGSYGKPGFVTAALKELCEQDRPDLVVAIGPLPMMNACVETTRPFGVKTMVSLNAIMVDGTGMCGSCRVTVGKEVRFACVDGPDFDGHQVDFKELLTRQKRFKGQEATAAEDYAHVCNLEKQLFEEQKHNYKKIKDLVPHQTRMPERDAKVRSRTFDEVNLGYSLADALSEAERCIQCAKPTCIAGCPVQIDIPRFIRHLLVRDIDGALEVINEASIFPSVCGRVCPQETQCEAQCIIAKKVESVGIGRLERFVGDHAKPRPVSAAPVMRRLGKVAVCGSGPAGLAAAADLVRYGCDVTVYEALHVVGGVLRYGIPSFRLPRDIIDREVKRLRDMGVRIETNKVIGKTFTVPQLLQEKGFDAVFLGVGAGAPAFLGIPGEFAGQVYSANEFLTRVNLMGGDKFPYLDTPISLGKSVVVIGAGNTAMDCLRVAKRLGRADGPLRLPAQRGRGAGPRGGAPPRQGGGDRVLLPPRAGRDLTSTPTGNVRGHEGRGDAAGRPGREGAPQADPHRATFATSSATPSSTRSGTKANPIITQLHPRPGAQQVGQHRRRRRQGRLHPGHQPAGRLRRRRHRHRRRHRDPGHGGRAPGGPRPSGPTWRAGRSGRSPPRRWPPSGPSRRPPRPSRAPPTPGRSPPAPRRPGRACPRCHRPVEEGEEYVCCGGQELRWRCQGCGKVSEGFAFPYGMCPACGGKLEVAEATQAAGAVVDGGHPAGLRDRAGRHGLLRPGGAQDAQDPTMKELFGRFQGMEREHMATLSRRYHVEIPPPAAVPGGAGRRLRRRPAASPPIRRTCSGWPSPSRSGRWPTSPSAWSAAPRARRSGSSTRSWPPRSGSTSTCSPPSRRWQAGEARAAVAAVPSQAAQLAG